MPGSRPSGTDAQAGRFTSRQLQILRLLTSHRRLTVADLAVRLEVSEESIRRDVRPLSAEGMVRKLHGAVALPEATAEPPMPRRMLENLEGKKRIARAVAEQIEDGESLMIDTGSTTIVVAQELAARQGLLVVTNSTEVGRTLAVVPGNQVFLAGGQLRAEDAAVLGASAVGFVQEFAVRTAILSIGAIDPEHGLMDFQAAEAEFCRAVVGQSARVIVVADHTKFGRRGFRRALGFDEVDLVVTDAPPPADIAARFAEYGVVLLVAGAAADEVG